MKKIVTLIICLILIGISLQSCTQTASRQDGKSTTSVNNDVDLKQAPPRLIPLEDFFRNPEKTGYQLSPQGDYLSFLQPWENRLNIHITKIGTEDVTRITESTTRDIQAYFWANNERIAFLQDNGGDENYHLFAVDRDGSNLKELTPFEGVKVTIVDDLKKQEDFMLISMNQRNAQIFDVYRIQIHTGELELIAENPGNVAFWMSDHEGKLRVGYTTDGVNTGLIYRKTESNPFEPILQTDFRSSVTPLLFTFDNNELYVASNLDRNTAAIYKFNPDTKQMGELIYEHPDVDVQQLLWSDAREKITGVTFIEEKRAYHFFDKQREALQNNLEKRLHGYEVIIASSSRDEQRLLIRTYSDRSLGSYYYYDQITDMFHKIVDVSPWLNENELAPMEPIEFTSRDGLTIHGYLTLPLGVDLINLPAVIIPHGGPWYRDSWGFSAAVQFLANRGYAVLQVNFRGSTGYGKEFWMKGFKQWGQAMQDDISDGVLWLIDEKIADSARIGIYGGSYGGYATLAGLTFTPELYACGVDYVGVSSIFSWIEAFPEYWKPYREMIYEMVGHPEEDEALLRSISPLYHVDKIEDPILIAQGANDPRVPKQESDQIVASLKERDIPVIYIVKENEGHGFQNEENRIELYNAIESFFAEYLGGRVEL